MPARLGILIFMTMTGCAASFAMDSMNADFQDGSAQVDRMITRQVLTPEEPRTTEGSVKSPPTLSTDMNRIIEDSHARYHVKDGLYVAVTREPNRSPNIVTFKQADPHKNILLRSLLDKIILEDENGDIDEIPGGFLNPSNYNLDTITVIKRGRSFGFTIKAKADVQVNFFEVSLSDTQMTATFRRGGERDFKFQLAAKLNAVILKGEMNISGNKTTAEYSCTFDNASPVNFTDEFFKGETSLTDHLLGSLTDVNLRTMFEYNIPTLNVVGVKWYSTNERAGSYQFIAFGEYTFPRRNLRLKIYCIVSKEINFPIAIGLIAKVETSLSLSEIISALTTIANFPKMKLFEGLQSRAIVTIANREVVYVTHPAIAKTLSGVKFGNYTKTITKGVAIHMGMKLKQKLSACSGLTSAYNNLNDETMITVKLDSTGVSIFPPNETINVTGIVTCLFGAADEFFKSDFAQSDSSFRFNRILYNRTSRQLEIDFEIHKAVRLISEDFLTINLLHVKVTRENDTAPVNFKISFNTTVDDSVYVGEISKRNEDYKIDLTVSMLPIGKIINAISATFADLSTSFSSMFDFGIKDFLFQAQWGETRIYRVAGSPYLFGFDDISLEGIIWIPEGKKIFEFAFGLSFNSVNLNDIVRLIVGTNSTTGAWLSDIDLVIIACSSTEGIMNAVQEVKQKVQPTAKPINSRRVRQRVRPTSRNTIERSSRLQRHRRHVAATSSSSYGRAPASSSSMTAPATKSTQRSIIRNQKTAPETGRRRRKRRRTRRRVSHAVEKKNIKPRRPQQVDATSSNSHKRAPASAPSSSAPTKTATTTRKQRASAASKMSFMHDTMKELTLMKGLTVVGEFSIPKREEDCRGDTVCIYLIEKAKDAVLTIKGTFEKLPTGYNISLAVELTMELNLTENLIFTKASLLVRIAGKDSYIKIAAELQYRQARSETVTFSGSISASAKALKIEMSMNNIWNKPFDIQQMAFGKLHLATTLNFKPVSVTIGFGGTLQLGKIGSVDIIEIQIYFGLSVATPINSYFYGNVSEITMEKVAKAFDLDVSGSDVMMESGFPEGLVFSYNGALAAIEIPQFNIKIEPGIYLKGKINMMGYSIGGEIQFHRPALKVKLELDPIDLNSGALIVQRDATDKENGPIFYGSINRTQVTLEIKGYIYTVGIGTAVTIFVDNTRFRMRIEGEMFQIVTATVDISARYGSLKASSFQVRGCILNGDVQTTFKNKVAEFLGNIADKAKQLRLQADDFKKGIDEMNKLLDTKKTAWEYEVEQRKNKLQHEIDAIVEQTKDSMSDCQSECPETCAGLPVWHSQCWKIFGYWVGCPGWNSCAYKSRSVLCLAKCHITNAANKVAGFFKQAGLEMKKGFLTFQAYLSTAITGVVTFALHVAKKAAAVAQAVLLAFERIMEAAEEIVKHTNFLTITHICLAAGVTDAKSACMELDVDVKLLNWPIKFKQPFCVGPNFLEETALVTSARQFPIAPKADKVEEVLKGEVDEVEKEKTDLDGKVAEVEHDVQKDDPDEQTRSKIATLGYNHDSVAGNGRSQINDNNESFDMKGFMDFRNAAPLTGKIEEYESGPEYGFSKKDTVDILLDNANNDHCKELRSVIAKYSSIVGGARRYNDAVDRQRLLFTRAKHYWMNDLDALKRTLEESEWARNVTNYRRRDMHTWYTRAQDKVDYWIEDTSQKVSSYENTAMKDYKRQLDAITKQHLNKDSVGYMRSLIEQGKLSIKRSGIPDAEAVNHSEKLSEVHQGLESIITGKRISTVATRRRLEAIERNINSLNALSHQC